MTATEVKIQPIGNRVLIKRSQAVKSKGGIILPDSAQEKPREGEVLAKGNGRVDEHGNKTAIDVEVGQRVVYSSFAGTPIEMDDPDAEYLILSEDDILGIIEA